MKIRQEITVASDPEVVWRLFEDVPELARCLPGAELTEDRGGGTYAGRVTAKLGPMTATFEGEATVTMDAAARRGSVEGRGVDRRGGSQGRVRMTYEVTPADDGGARIVVDADVLLSGAAAQFGRTGLIDEMSRRLVVDFVACLEAKLAATTPEDAAAVSAGEVSGLTLFLTSLWATITGALRRLLRRS
jgi:Uncharacterized conserved protein